MNIWNNIKLLGNPLLINAFVYHKNGNVVHNNWGDDINYYFLREICQRSIVMYDQIPLAFWLKLNNYLVIGSTIDMLCKVNTEVWGAGIIDGAKPLRTKPKKVYAVRGPLTRNVLMQQGVDCPEVYGDPALLIAKYYQPNVKKEFKYGFISHVSNINLIKTLLIDGDPLTKRTDILIINLSDYAKWTDIPDQICSCENIISGSLHGLIMAEAYNIPNVWVKFGNPLIGDEFKFHDFFQSIGQERENPIHVLNNKMDMGLIDDSLSQWKAGKIDLQPLLESCPFEIMKPLYE